MIDENPKKILNKYNSSLTQRSVNMSKELTEILENFKEICEFVIEDFIYNKSKQEENNE